MIMENKFFNSVHAPLGAHSSFSLGCKGKLGGLGLEMKHPACENIYIGVENRDNKLYKALPFFGDVEDLSAQYEDSEITENNKEQVVKIFKDEDIVRDYQIGTDSWEAGDMKFTILSAPIVAIEPNKGDEAGEKLAYCPSVLVEFKIDNRDCGKERVAFFGFEAGNSTDSMHFVYNIDKKYTAIAKGQATAMYTDAPNTVAAQGFSAEHILSEKVKENYNFGLGDTGLLLFKVPANEVATFKIAVCFHRAGVVTSGEKSSYWYTKYFEDLQEVGTYALANYQYYYDNAQKINQEFSADKLNDAQKFHLIHTVKCYFQSTQLLNWDGEPFWVVNEGEFRMMNTFDLTVDQLFFELKQNPWTVKNELDMYVKRYSYEDKIFDHNDESKLYDGGISFTHDMGRYNHISRPQYSTYEMFGLDGCFSHMTHEQLVNWVLCASTYVKKTGDTNWFKENVNIFEKCLTSMMNRDNPDPAKRNGIMAFDSSRTLPAGAEITTYDSLDTSLGQARNNVYIAVKSWAAYLALADLLEGESSTNSLAQAEKAAATISSFLNEEGYIPAVMGEDCNSQIIPAIEGLVFPQVMGMSDALKEDGKYGNLIKALKTHFQTVLKKGVCLYDSGAWKLSSSADNSWLSKIYLCQFVAREVLGFKNADTTINADIAHQEWLLRDTNIFFAWSDQMKSGNAIGSKYYPRGVTTILWLEEK